MSVTHRLGVDIGGTFTDAILIDESTGDVRIAKVPSTPDDPSRGFLNAVTRILKEAEVVPGDLSYVVHATTVATNSIIEHKLAPTGFLATEGFRGPAGDPATDPGVVVRRSLREAGSAGPALLVLWRPGAP